MAITTIFLRSNIREQIKWNNFFPEKNFWRRDFSMNSKTQLWEGSRENFGVFLKKNMDQTPKRLKEKILNFFQKWKKKLNLALLPWKVSKPFWQPVEKIRPNFRSFYCENCENNRKVKQIVWRRSFYRRKYTVKKWMRFR